MFMGPLDGSIAWSTNGLDGSRRFLDRIWRLFIEDNGTLNSKIQENEKASNLEKVYHQTVKKVTEDYEHLRFNTAISQMMVFINEAYKATSLPVSFMEGFVKLLHHLSAYC